MLNNSFLHIPSVGASTEKKIWDIGIESMDDFLKSAPQFLSIKKRKKMEEHIVLSKEKIIEKNARFFYDSLPSKEHWRLFKEHQDSAVYLDIETTGMESWDIISTIALYDGANINYYVNGKNLNDFKKDIQKYEVIITYNGKTFDIPFIERYFNININHIQLDLRYILRSLGYSGGLKSCEKQFGIGRTGSLADVDGMLAVYLWKDYQKKKNQKTLDTLLSYNIEDVLNLQYLMINAYNKKIELLPFDLAKLHLPIKPENPFNIDSDTVNRIQSQYFYY